MCSTASLNTEFQCGCYGVRDVIKVDCKRADCSLSSIHRVSGHQCGPQCAPKRGGNVHLLDETAKYNCERHGGPTPFKGP